MSKKRKSDNENPTLKTVILVTAIIQLIIAIIDFVDKLIN